jgi:hypothetical protein
MTGRGRKATPPPIPTDPSLITRPVPRRRAFKTHAFGPGAAPNLELQQSPRNLWLRGLDDVEKLLGHIDSWAHLDFDGDIHAPYDGTWGYYVFLTSYDDATLGKLEQAMGNWVKVVERKLATSNEPEDKKEELRKRFKFDLIMDKEELAGASNDRVRENFRALMYGLDLLTEDRKWLSLCRYFVCLVIDAAAVDTLAGLEFHENPRAEDAMFENLTVTAIDANWDREEEQHFDRAGEKTYYGVGQLGINCLQEMYLRITGDGCNKAMDDLHPLNGYPGQ